jgi:hypothetical protein
VSIVVAVIAAGFVQLVAKPRPGPDLGVAGRFEMLANRRMPRFLPACALISDLTRDFETNSICWDHIIAMGNDHGCCIKMRPN